MNPMLIVTIAAVAFASIMSLVAWKVVRDDRSRSDARVAALAADIHRVGAEDAGDVPLRDGPVGLFANEAPPQQRHALATVIGAGALVVGGVAAILVMATSGAHPVASAPPAAAVAKPPTAAAAATEPQALELVALGHEREGDRLTVRGVVRNPDDGSAVRHLAAVVLLFNGDGGFLTSGRAEVTGAGLVPGTEAPFVVTVPGAAEVGRYRVSFRTDDRVVPHVDRRNK